jgi:hypothetical protein
MQRKSKVVVRTVYLQRARLHPPAGDGQRCGRRANAIDERFACVLRLDTRARFAVPTQL